MSQETSSADQAAGDGEARPAAHIEAAEAEADWAPPPSGIARLERTFHGLLAHVDAHLTEHLRAEVERHFAHLQKFLAQTITVQVHGQIAHVSAGLARHFSDEIQRQVSHVNGGLAEHITHEVQRQVAHVDAHLADELRSEMAGVSAHLSAYLAQEIQRQLDRVDAHLAAELRSEVAGANAHLSTYLAQETHRQLSHVDDHLTERLSALALVRAAETGAPSPGTRRRVLSLARLLAPQAIEGRAKVRRGAEHDGGYVMVDDFRPGGEALSLGIGQEITWDLAMAADGYRVHQYDHTVEGPPEDHPGFRFHRSRIVPGPEEGGTTIAAILDALPVDGDLILKMDIEGDEWPVLAALDPGVLARFSQIVCEFHEFRRIDDDAWFDTARSVLGKLDESFGVVHVHANNYGPLLTPGNVPFPDILEVTFANRARYRLVPTDELFPGPLDAPNRPDLPDIALGAFRFAEEQGGSVP